MIRSSTRLFAVLGDPVAHSLSPSIQNAAFEAAGVDGVYVALRCAESALAGLIRGIAQAGGGGNVTLPHKRAAAAIVDEPSGWVTRTGACNTFWLEDGRVRGDNTDVAGFRGAVESLIGRAPGGANVLLVGAGGAARAALVALIEDRVDSVSVWNRSRTRAEALAQELGGGKTRVLDSADDLAADPFDLVIQATSLGIGTEDPLPLDLDLLRRPGALLDLVYRPEESALVREARARGIPAADGGEMLVRQGAEAFVRWWAEPAPLDVMMGALDRVRATETHAHD